jgi:hypothetical protein
MMGPTHALFGATTYAALPIIGVPAPLIGLPIAAISALLPDLDLRQSTASKFLGPIGSGVRLFSGGHRKRTHQLWLVGLLIIALIIWAPLFAMPVGVGYISHLIGDQIPDTDSWLERLIAAVLWVALPAALIYGHVLDRQVIAW